MEVNFKAKRLIYKIVYHSLVALVMVGLCLDTTCTLALKRYAAEDQYLRPSYTRNTMALLENLKNDMSRNGQPVLQAVSPSLQRGVVIPGAGVTVPVTHGIVAVEVNGLLVPVPAGNILRPGDRVPNRMNEKDIREYSKGADILGIPMTALDIIEAEIVTSYHMAQENKARFNRMNKRSVIELNTDMLPDVEGPDNRAVVEGILTTIAYKIRQFRRDGRLMGPGAGVYISFVSRTNTPDSISKNQRVRELFTGLHESIDDRQMSADLLQGMLMPEDLKADVKVTVTNLDDVGDFDDLVLMLKTDVIVDGRIQVYAWDTIMDLCIGMTSVDRDDLQAQQELLIALRNIFEDLIKSEIDDDKPLTMQDMRDMFSNNPEARRQAAQKIAGHLEPIHSIDYEAIEELNRIMEDIARYA